MKVSAKDLQEKSTPESACQYMVDISAELKVEDTLSYLRALNIPEYSHIIGSIFRSRAKGFFHMLMRVMSAQLTKNKNDEDDHVARVHARIISYKHHPRQWEASGDWVCLWTPADMDKLIRGLNRANYGSKLMFTEDMGDHEGKVVVFRSESLEKAVEEWTTYRYYMSIPKYFGDEEFVIAGDGVEISCSLLCS